MQSNEDQSPRPPSWGAVRAMSLGVAVLTAAEMLPVSLLTPIARDLAITEGVAGQTITATAVVALVASLLTAVAARRLDRRTLLLSLSALQVVSCLLAGLAPNLATLMLGRLLLGVAVGGFWSMSAALAMRLVPAAMVPRALALIFGGVSIATIAAAPVGSFLGDLIGWRGVFLLAAVLAVIALAWQVATLPAMTARGEARLATLFHVLERPQVKLGMLAVILVFAGHFAFFTYLRPFLEEVTGMGVKGVSAILLAFGLGNFLGTWFAGRMLAFSLRWTLLAMPLMMAVLALGLILFGRVPVLASVFITLWGFAFGTVPVGWSTWLTRTVPDDAESGGGLLVAAIQVAITLGAALGGALFHLGSVTGAFTGGGVLLLVAAATVLAGVRSRNNAGPGMPAGLHSARTSVSR